MMEKTGFYKSGRVAWYTCLFFVHSRPQQYQPQNLSGPHAFCASCWVWYWAASLFDFLSSSSRCCCLYRSVTASMLIIEPATTFRGE